MGLSQQRIATALLLTFILSTSVMAIVPVNGTWDSGMTAPDLQNQYQASESLLNLTIPYVDRHYGIPDGIIDPEEYASNYTDPVSGITVYLEQNSTVLFVGLEAQTTGWIGLGWKNYTDTFTSDGLNNSDLIFGYTPGTLYDNVERVTLNDVVTVHYILTFRNGTLIQEGDVPGADETPLSDADLLQDYKDEIVGMRIGEVRHFVIPAENGYINQPTNPLYGYDLEYVITLTRINSNYINPGDRSDIVYSNEHGIGTFQHQPDANQSRILLADGSDDGHTTRLEYFIQMNSTDVNGIPLLNGTDLSYPLFLMYGDTEDIYELPVQHSEWTTPPRITLPPNTGPEIIINNPEADSTYGYVTKLSVNASDNTFVRRVFYRMDEENWTEISYDFKTDFWEDSIDLTDFDPGTHTIWINATDASNATTTESIDINVARPYAPLLGMKLDVVHTYSTKLYHTAEVRDDFTVTNNGSAPINAIEFFVPKDYAILMLDISGVDGESNDLLLVRLEDYQGFYHWRVYFHESVDFQAVYTFSIIAHYHSTHTITDFDTNTYEVTFPKLPTVPYVLKNAQFVLAFRSGDSLPTGETSPEGTWTNLAPMQDEVMNFSMRSFTPYIVADRQTDITLNPWGWLEYHETIFMENLGNTKETVFTFSLPKYTTTVVVYDHVGILAATQPGGTWALNDSIDLNVNLLKDRFGDNGFWPGYKYTFHIDYRVEIDGFDEQTANGNRLEIPMGLFGDVLVKEHVVNLDLPYSVNTVDVSGNYRLLHGAFDTTLQYKVYNTTRYNAPQITIVYSPTVSASARPLFFSLIIGLVAGLFVLARRVEFEEGSDTISEKERDIDTRQSGAPVDLLSQFAKAYSQKTAFALDLEKLESARRKGKVRKKEFMIRERDLKSQIQELDSELPSLKEELMQYGSRYRDLISQLELQDEKIEGAKAGLKQLLIRKKKQRISRAAFEKSRQDYLKTIKRATTATDRILMTIQEEAGEI